MIEEIVRLRSCVGVAGTFRSVGCAGRWSGCVVLSGRVWLDRSPVTAPSCAPQFNLADRRRAGGRELALFRHGAFWSLACAGSLSKIGPSSEASCWRDSSSFAPCFPFTLLLSPTVISSRVLGSSASLPNTLCRFFGRSSGNSSSHSALLELSASSLGSGGS